MLLLHSKLNSFHGKLVTPPGTLRPLSAIWVKMWDDDLKAVQLVIVKINGVESSL